MTEYRSVLERAGSNAPQPDLQLERVLRRHDRRLRNRRIRAGALGVIVTLALGTIFVRTLTADPVPADPPVGPRPAPATSGTLAYGLDGDIYVADPDGSNAVKIADGRPEEDCTGRPDGRSYWAERSMWSPDGRYLAYRYRECSDPVLWGVVVSDAEGNVLATFPTAAGWQIAWSPDSTRVAVWDDFKGAIGVYGLDGARQTQLTMPPDPFQCGDCDPVWMPEGTSLMVPNVEVPLDGGPLRQLPLPARAYSIAYSPDGSRVGYVDHGSLIVARSDGSEPREVFGDGAWGLTWSPNGERIGFTTSGDVRRIDELHVLDVATGSATVLTEGERGTTLSVIGFSPQGDRILFSKTDDGTGEGSLWSIGVDGSDPRLLVAGAANGDWLSPSQIG